MAERRIAHVDMDAFYASVEVRDAPELAGKPVVVGGSAEGRGVVSAASYEARKFGIHSAMPMARAQRLCPELVRIDPNFARYRADSEAIMEILGQFSPCVEPLSLDEAFLDLTGTEAVLGASERVAREVKRRIYSHTRLVASVGIAPVKFIAKIASDLRKPDGLVIVAAGTERAFLAPLPIGRLWGVGPRTREALEGLGVTTIGDLARRDPTELERRLGEHGGSLVRLARGEDARGVVPDAEAKSYSHEETFARDTAEAEFLEGVLLAQAIRVARRLRADGVAGRTVQLKLRTADFRTTTRQRTLPAAVVDEDVIFDTARSLFRTHWRGGPVRLIGCGVSAVEAEGQGPLDLFAPADRGTRKRSLADAIDRLGDRFGSSAVTRARLCAPDSAPAEVREPGSGRLVSEPLQAGQEWLSVEGMTRGEPGTPAVFTWRGGEHRVRRCVRSWKTTRVEFSGERYVHRHYLELQMEDGAAWTVYCLRQVRRGASTGRWYLFRVD